MRRSQLFAYLLVAGLAACGGGGGGDSSSGGSTPAGSGSGSGSGGGAAGGGGGGTTPTSTGGSTSTRNPVPEQVALTFTGATTPATVNATSAARLTSDTMMSTRLAQVIRSEELALIGTSSSLTGTAAIASIPCDSGSITITRGAMNSNGAGTLNLDYVDCRKGNDTLNGPATMTITRYNTTSRIITDARVDFTRASFTGPNLDADISGTQQTEVLSTRPSWCSTDGCGTERLTQDMTILVRESETVSRTMRSQVVINNGYQSITAPTFFTQSVSGQVSDDQLGSVTVSTDAAPFTAPWSPLYYSTRFQSFPDWGIVNLTGATISRARVSSMGIGLAKIEVNADGLDDVYEINARVRWIDLRRDIASNLSDRDGDRMHDSYETANGLLVGNNDASGDADADGWTNYQEYLVGAAAGTNGSVASDVRHLWVTHLSEIDGSPSSNTISVFIDSSGDGTTLDTETGELGVATTGGTLPASGNGRRTFTEGTVTYTLSPTASASVWTLSSSNGASITIDNVAGTEPGSLIRYGTRGLAFRTTGSAPSSSSAAGGYIYLIESRTLIP